MSGIVIQHFQARTGKFVIVSMFVEMGASVFCAFNPQFGTSTAILINFVLLAAFVVICIHHQDRLLMRLLVFGLVVGVLELFADDVGVEIGGLKYPKRIHHIHHSPIYMPIAWLNVLVQIGYLSILLMQWRGHLVAIAVVTMLGGLYIPVYEAIARHANWWHYEDVPMLHILGRDTGASVSAFLAEAMLCMLVPWMIIQISKNGTFSAFYFGIVHSVRLFVSTIIGVILSYLIYFI